MEAAEARGVTHPADAVPVFQRLGANALEGGNRAAYAHGQHSSGGRTALRRRPG